MLFPQMGKFFIPRRYTFDPKINSKFALYNTRGFGKFIPDGFGSKWYYILWGTSMQSKTMACLITSAHL